MQPEKLLSQLIKTSTAIKTYQKATCFPPLETRKLKKRGRGGERKKVRIRLSFMYADFDFSHNRMKATS